MQFVVVGNGELERDGAAEIDAADCVVRINRCKNYGAFAGRRTHLLALSNTDRSIKRFLEAGLVHWPAFTDAASIILPRSPLLYGMLGAASKKTAEFFKDHSALLRAAARPSGKPVKTFGLVENAALFVKLRRYELGPWLMPSTGIIMIEHLVQRVMKPGDRLNIYGFQHTGWKGHPWAAERALVDSYVKEGRVRRR